MSKIIILIGMMAAAALVAGESSIDTTSFFIDGGSNFTVPVSKQCVGVEQRTGQFIRKVA